MDGNLRQLFRANLPQFHFVSIETGGTGRGIPDCEYCFKGKTGWIEFKLTSGWMAGMRPEQVGWIERRIRAGGRVFIAVRRKTEAGPRKGVAGDALWLFKGEAVRALATEPLNRVVPAGHSWLCGTWIGGSSYWNWPEIARILTA